jgi:hypothetical protein
VPVVGRGEKSKISVGYYQNAPIRNHGTHFDKKTNVYAEDERHTDGMESRSTKAQGVGHLPAECSDTHRHACHSKGPGHGHRPDIRWSRGQGPAQNLTFVAGQNLDPIFSATLLPTQALALTGPAATAAAPGRTRSALWHVRGIIKLESKLERPAAAAWRKEKRGEDKEKKKREGKKGRREG